MALRSISAFMALLMVISMGCKSNRSNYQAPGIVATTPAPAPCPTCPNAAPPGIGVLPPR